ncbi:MAG: amidase, partial [Acidobacteriia bacterium]|nr:amidase [Terriglobia bacterium]
VPRFAAAGKRTSRSGKFRLGLLREFPSDRVSPDILSVFENALASLRKQGVTMKNISVPLWKESEDAGNEIAWPEATFYHQQSGWFPARAADYGEDVRTRLEMGTRVPATVYLKALETREKFIQQLHLALEDGKLDAIVVPTTPIAAPLIDEDTTRIGEKDLPTRALLLGPNRPANLAGVPAISVPCGFTSSGLPAGLQFIGAAGDEALLLRIAALVERAHPATRRPSI